MRKYGQLNLHTSKNEENICKFNYHLFLLYLFFVWLITKKFMMAAVISYQWRIVNWTELMRMLVQDYIRFTKPQLSQCSRRHRRQENPIGETSNFPLVEMLLVVRSFRPNRRLAYHAAILETTKERKSKRRLRLTEDFRSRFRFFSNAHSPDTLRSMKTNKKISWQSSTGTKLSDNEKCIRAIL